MRVVLVIGLPASGKSTWARIEAARLRNRGHAAQVLDDPVSMEDVQRDVALALSQGAHSLFVVDPNLCRSPIRDAAVDWFKRQALAVECVFFANEPEQCLRNAMARSHDAKPVRSDVLSLSRVYFPEGDLLPVFGSR